MTPGKRLKAALDAQHVSPTELGERLKARGYKSGYRVVRKWILDNNFSERARIACAEVLGLEPDAFAQTLDEASTARTIHEPDGGTAAVVEEYLDSPRGRSAAPEVQALLRDSSQTAFLDLGVARPAWEDVDDLRRILERKVRGQHERRDVGAEAAESVQRETGFVPTALRPTKTRGSR